VWDGIEIRSCGFETNEHWLEQLKSGRPDATLVIEKVVSYGMAVGAETFETVFWSGRFAQSFLGEHVRIDRKEIKLHICESARATDSNIRQALIDRFGDPGKKASPGLLYPLKGHTWAAFAVAVTWMDKYGGKS
jgi:hypothetical protein